MRGNFSRMNVSGEDNSLALIVDDVVDSGGQVLGDHCLQFFFAGDGSVAGQGEGSVDGVDECVNRWRQVGSNFCVAFELADSELEILFVVDLEALRVAHVFPQDLGLFQQLLVVEPCGAGSELAGCNDDDGNFVTTQLGAHADSETFNGIVHGGLDTSDRVVNFSQSRRQEDESTASAADEWQEDLRHFDHVENVHLEGLSQHLLGDPLELADCTPLLDRDHGPQADGSVGQVAFDEFHGFVHL